MAAQPEILNVVASFWEETAYMDNSVFLCKLAEHTRTYSFSLFRMGALTHTLSISHSCTRTHSFCLFLPLTLALTPALFSFSFFCTHTSIHKHNFLSLFTHKHSRTRTYKHTHARRDKCFSYLLFKSCATQWWVFAMNWVAPVSFSTLSLWPSRGLRVYLELELDWKLGRDKRLDFFQTVVVQY